MQRRAIIGIPTQTLQAIDGVPEHLPLSWVMNHRYYVAVAQAGGAPFMVPLLVGVRNVAYPLLNALGFEHSSSPCSGCFERQHEDRALPAIDDA